MSEWAHVRSIARIELRRQWRSLQENAPQVIATALLVLLFVPVSLLGLVGVFVFGMGIGSGDLETPLEWTRIGLVYTWIFIAGFGGYRAYATALRPDRLDGLLTTVSHRELLGGLLLAELFLWGVPVGLLGVGAGLALAVGAGSIPAAPLAMLAVWTLLLTALSTGFVLALVVMNTGVRSVLVTRLRTGLFLLLGAAYFGLIVTQNVDAVLVPLFWALEPTPVGWYGDLVLLGTVSEASVARAVGAVLVSLVFLAGSAVALPRLAALLWYADGTTVERDVSTTDPTAGTARLSRLLPRPIVGVALVDWKRARRAPIALSFALYPLVLLVNPTMTLLQTGTVSSSFPLWVLLCGGWLTGVLFALNVVGNEGAVLPTTILSRAPGRSLVGGHVAAGVLPGVPLTLAATVGLGVASPHSGGAVVTLAVSAFVLTVCAGPIATGIGAAFPRFEAVSVSRSTKSIVPSMLAFSVYSVVLALLAVPTLLGHSSIVGHAIASLFDTSPFVVAITGTALSALVAVPAGLLSARYAVRSVEAYHFD